MHEVADVGDLGVGQPLQFVVIEDQRRASLAERFAPRRIFFGRAAFGELSDDLRHDRFRVGVAHVHDGFRLVEVQHTRLHAAADRRAPPFGQCVVGILHGQHEGLIQQVAVFARRRVAARADRADDECGPEFFVERPPREVVVDAAVVQQHRVFLHRFEYQRYGHRRAYRFSQVAAAQHGRPAAVHVAGHAQKGHHQPVEVASGRCRRRSEQLGESHVDLRRGDQAGRYAEFAFGVAQVETEAYHPGGAAHLAVVGHVARGVYAPRHPLLDHARGDDRPHLGRRVARRIHRRHDRPHRCARHAVDRHPLFFQRLQHADVVEAFGSAAAHYHAYAPAFGAVGGSGFKVGSGGCRYRRHRQHQQKNR